MAQNITNGSPLMKQISMAGFFSKKQYAATTDKELAMKLQKERCLECPICAIFFSLSLTISIKTLSLSRILSTILIREFLILFLTYPLSAQSFPLIVTKNLPCLNSSQSSTFPGVNIKLSRHCH